MGVHSRASRKFDPAPGKWSANPKMAGKSLDAAEPGAPPGTGIGPGFGISETVTDVANPMSGLAKSRSSILPGLDPVSMFGINSELQE